MASRAAISRPRAKPGGSGLSIGRAFSSSSFSWSRKPTVQSRRMRAGKNDPERLIAFGKNGGFVVADRLDFQGRDAGPAHLRGKPGLPLVVADAARDHATPTRIPGDAREQIGNNRPLALIADLVDIINEQGCTTATAEFVEEFILRDSAAD